MSTVQSLRPRPPEAPGATAPSVLLLSVVCRAAVLSFWVELDDFWDEKIVLVLLRMRSKERGLKRNEIVGRQAAKTPTPHSTMPQYRYSVMVTGTF